MSINELLKQIDDLNKKIEIESRKDLKRKLMIQDEIKELENERSKAGFRGDGLTVEKYNIEIKKLNHQISQTPVLSLESQIKACKQKITSIIINYYKKGKRIDEILEIEGVPQNIRDEWINSSNFGKDTGYLFVNPTNKSNENNWEYFNPITGVKVEGKSISNLKLKVNRYHENLIAFDDRLTKKSINKDIRRNPVVNYGWNDSKFDKVKEKSTPKNKKTDSKKDINPKNMSSKPKKNKKSKKSKSKNNNSASKIKKSKKINKKPQKLESELVQKLKKIKHKDNSNSKEEYAIVLDYYKHGYPNQSKTKFDGKPIAQGVGVNGFTFLEMAPKNGIDLEIHDLVYVGKGKRDKIYRVLGKLELDNLTSLSRIELEYVIEDIVEANEERYVEFFNNSKTISQDLHELGLLQGVGAKTVRIILDERGRKKFESFEDIKNRVSTIKDPKTLVVYRIKEELGLMESKRKHKRYLFTQEPRAPKVRKRK